MNIFYLDRDPKLCAEMHVDKHCVKMILEYAQLLSTAHRILDGTQSVCLSKTGRKQVRYVLSDQRENVLYSATHINHPSAIWVRKSRDNYAWLYQLLDCLCKEYTYRYGKRHKSQDVIEWCLINKPNIADKEFTEPARAMPDEYKSNCVVESYRSYYMGEKSKIAVWKNRETPEWFKMEMV